MSKALIPLWGAALGAIGAVIFTASSKAVPALFAELAVAILWGVLAFAPHEKRRFGIAGGIILAATITLRWMAIDTLLPARVWEVFIASQTVPRAAMITIAWASRQAPEEGIFEFARSLTTPAALFSIMLGIAAAFLCGLRPALAIMVGAYLIVRIVHWFSYRYVGGVSADSLGTTQLLTELFVLMLFTCSACRW